MRDKTDPHLNILLNIEEKLGDLKAESRGQSEILISLDNRVKEANHKTAKNVLEIQAVKDEIQVIRDEKNINKGKMFVFMAIGGFVMTIVSAILVILIKRYFGI